MSSSCCVIEIVIDERETELYAEIMRINKAGVIPIVKRVLPIGDILFLHKQPAAAPTQDEEQPPQPKTIMIFERKSLQDLLASILDGRYKEQSFRLSATTETTTHNIVYLIEGLMSSIKDPRKKQRIYSAMTSIHYFKKMSVLRTWAVQESAELLLQMATKINRELTEPSAGNAVIEMEQQYSSCVVSKIKHENITPGNIGEIVLSQIPGISLLAAKSIISRFDNSFERLMQVLLNDPYNSRLDDIMYEISAGKMRRISKTSVENMRKFLVPSSPERPVVATAVKKPRGKRGASAGGDEVVVNEVIADNVLDVLDNVVPTVKKRGKKAAAVGDDVPTTIPAVKKRGKKTACGEVIAE